MSEATKAEIVAALRILQAVADAIRDAGELGLSSGGLYTILSSKIQITLGQYEKMIALLVEGKLVNQWHHQLIWVGPAKDGAANVTVGNPDQTV